MQYIVEIEKQEEIEKFEKIVQELKDVKISKLEEEKELLSLQEESLTHTWDNQEDKVWDEL